MAKSPAIDAQGQVLLATHIVEDVTNGTLFNVKHGWFETLDGRRMHGWYLYRNDEGVRTVTPLTATLGNTLRLHSSRLLNPELWDKIDGLE